MPFNRVKFADNAGFTVGVYTLPMNPVELELNDSREQELVSILDGPSVLQEAQFDDRQFKMTWVNMPKNLAGFTTMLTTLKSYVHATKYVNFASIDYRTTPAVEQVRIDDVKVTINRGGKIKYNVEMTMTPLV